MFSIDSGKLILDNLLVTVKAPIIALKEDIEEALSNGHCSDGTGRTGPPGFMIESDNVSLEVCNNYAMHNVNSNLF